VTFCNYTEDQIYRYLLDCIHSNFLWRCSRQQVKQLTQQLR